MTPGLWNMTFNSRRGGQAALVGDGYATLGVIQRLLGQIKALASTQKIDTKDLAKFFADLLRFSISFRLSIALGVQWVPSTNEFCVLKFVVLREVNFVLHQEGNKWCFGVNLEEVSKN